MKSIVIPIPSLNLGTVSFRRRWFWYGSYLLCLLCFAFIVRNSDNKITLDFQYYEVTDFNEITLRGGGPPSLPSIFASRLALLRSTCRRYSNPLRSDHFVSSVESPPDRFFFNAKPKVMACMIPKVASSSFANFFQLLNANSKAEWKGIKIYPDPFYREANDAYKVMVVRHPFERLVSAYNYIFLQEVKADKNRPSSLYSNLTRSLVKAYRPGTTDEEANEAFVTFPEFVRYLVNATIERDILLPRKRTHDWIDDPQLNSHWMPYWLRCTPCTKELQPSIILKMDQGDFREEVNFMLQDSGIAQEFKKLASDFPWKNPTNSGRARDWVAKCFGQISKGAVLELHHKYRADFEMFGYDLEPYLTLAHD